MNSGRNFTNNKRTHGISAILVLSASICLSGCAALASSPGIGESLSGMGNKIKSSFQRVTTRGSDTRARPGKGADYIAAQYPAHQMPHVMMKKPLADGRLSSGFGYRINPKGIRLPKRHKGVDYAAPTGTPVYAAADGVIDKLYTSRSYGNYIRVKHENDFSTAYAHMNAFAEGLEDGSAVSRGQIIGHVGSTGRSSGAHLHFELIHKGHFIDPLFQHTPSTLIASEDETPDDT